MAKKKQTTSEKQITSEKPTTLEKLESRETNGHVGVSVPITEVDASAYCSDHVEVRLDANQRRNLKRVFAGLDAVGERLANGRRVQSNADVFRWIMEQVG